MNCIFCKQNSNTSKSVEHIVPESLGNKEHVLHKGIVCDSCNNYFSNKIEKPLMESPYFVSLRHRNLIKSKKGRIPNDVGVLMGLDGFKVNFHIDEKGKYLSFENKEAEKAMDFLKQTKKGTILAAVNEAPPDNNLHISKLLGKIAIEALAKIAVDVVGGLDDVLHNTSLDLLRGYVRFGLKVKFWPYTTRLIYPEQHFFKDAPHEMSYEILHEYHFFQTDEHIWHVCLILFGVEYCLNMCEPTTINYENWLHRNNNKSPLY